MWPRLGGQWGQGPSILEATPGREDVMVQVTGNLGGGVSRPVKGQLGYVRRTRSCTNGGRESRKEVTGFGGWGDTGDMSEKAWSPVGLRGVLRRRVT